MCLILCRRLHFPCAEAILDFRFKTARKIEAPAGRGYGTRLQGLRKLRSVPGTASPPTQQLEAEETSSNMLPGAPLVALDRNAAHNVPDTAAERAYQAPVDTSSNPRNPSTLAKEEHAMWNPDQSRRSSFLDSASSALDEEESLENKHGKGNTEDASGKEDTEIPQQSNPDGTRRRPSLGPASSYLDEEKSLVQERSKRNAGGEGGKDSEKPQESLNRRVVCLNRYLAFAMFTSLCALTVLWLAVLVICRRQLSQALCGQCCPGCVCEGGIDMETGQR